MPSVDFRAPDYAAIERARELNLRILRAGIDDGCGRIISPIMGDVKAYYKDNIAQFINDWGVTYDPRNPERGIPAHVPFILFPKQIEFIDFIIDNWRNQRRAIAEKSRDMGLSWLMVAAGAALCIFNEGLSIGYGSNLEKNVDESNNPDSLFWKARMFIGNLPEEFRGGWDRKANSQHMRLSFPETGSVMVGSAGDNIGRGGRNSIFMLDESASIERPQLVDAALSQTTNCRIDTSTPRGTANPFAVKRFSGKYPVFTFHWRDDPRKDQDWYQRQCDQLDPVTVAQEIDLNYTASVEGVVIPSEWIQAAIDAHITLGIKPTGQRMGAMDVADEGKDKNALAIGYGILVQSATEWSGKGSDIHASVERAVGLLDSEGIYEFKYDADGLGASVSGSVRVINEQRRAERRTEMEAQAYRGSAEVFAPDSQDFPPRKNKDYFMNRKAQDWFGLRKRFYTTFRAIKHGDPFDPDDIISLSSEIPNLGKLTMELSQPTYKLNALGKIVIDKSPDGMSSPNLADSVMILYGRAKKPPMVISEAVFDRGLRWR